MGRPKILSWTLLAPVVVVLLPSILEMSLASKPQSSMISVIRDGDSFSGSCTITARSANRLTLNCTNPSTSLNPPSTADVHAPQVMPSIATVVVVAFLLNGFRLAFGASAAGSAAFVSMTSASKPVSSMVSASFSGDITAGSCSITALSESSDMLHPPTPGTPLNAPSTADVHAPHVMPPTCNVVVTLPSDTVRSSLSASSSASNSASCSSGRPELRTSASNPLSSTISANCTALIFSTSWETTARSMTKLTETLPTPSAPFKPASTEEVHAPHVIPSTLRVVVVQRAAREGAMEADM